MNTISSGTFRKELINAGFILIQTRKEYTVAVKEERGINGNFFTFGRVYNICGKHHYEQNGCATFATHRDATVAACEFYGIN